MIKNKIQRVGFKLIFGNIYQTKGVDLYCKRYFEKFSFSSNVFKWLKCDVSVR